MERFITGSSHAGSTRSRGQSVSQVTEYSQLSNREGHGRTVNVLKAIQKFAGSEDSVRCCGCTWSQASRTLVVSLVLFSTITCAQVVGALIANSMALLADCASMGLDAVTYAFNLYADCRQEPDPRKRTRNELIASGISYAALIGVSVYFLCDGIQGLVEADFTDDDDVNPYIVFGFAVAGILFDVVSLTPYCLFGCPCGPKKGKDGVDEGGERENLTSALLHVSADLVRSCTTLLESILIWAADVNGAEADTYATVCVTATIVVGLLKPCYGWVQKVREFHRPEETEVCTEMRRTSVDYHEFAKDP